MSKYLGIGYGSMNFDIKLKNPAFDFHIIFSKEADGLNYARCLEFDLLTYGKSLEESCANLLKELAEFIFINIEQNTINNIFDFTADKSYWSEYNSIKQKITIDTLNKVKTYKDNIEHFVIVKDPAMKIAFDFGTVKIAMKETWLIDTAA
ncbi:MAG TPA: hypothetical protein PKY81_10430 [bacterium]|nr:hypothetical protein [bacterium]